MLALLRAFLSDDNTLPPAEVRKRSKDGVLVDVRTPAEYVFGHLDGAINVDARARDFDDLVASLDKSRPYYLYCSSGRRSRHALKRMQRRGFSRVHNAGSLSDLAVAGVPLAP